MKDRRLKNCLGIMDRRTVVLGPAGRTDQCRVQGWGRQGILVGGREGQLWLVIVLVQHGIDVPLALLSNISSMRVLLVLSPCTCVVDIILLVESRSEVMINIATVVHDLGQVLVKASTATSHRAGSRIGGVLLEDGRARPVTLVRRSVSVVDSVVVVGRLVVSVVMWLQRSGIADVGLHLIVIVVIVSSMCRGDAVTADIVARGDDGARAGQIVMTGTLVR